MKMLLAATMLLGFASFSSAHAEWEILDAGSAVSAITKATQSASGTTTNVATKTARGNEQGKATSK